jgi:hypothetical protein
VPLGWFAVALLLMLAGLLGTVVPFLPGLPLVLAGVYVYAFGTSLNAGIGLGHVILYPLVGGAAIVLSTLAHLLGARAAGGSCAGMFGTAIGLCSDSCLADRSACCSVRSWVRSGSSCWLAVQHRLHCGAASPRRWACCSVALTIAVGLIASFVGAVVGSDVLGRPGAA